MALCPRSPCPVLTHPVPIPGFSPPLCPLSLLLSRALHHSAPRGRLPGGGQGAGEHRQWEFGKWGIGEGAGEGEGAREGRRGGVAEGEGGGAGGGAERAGQALAATRVLGRGRYWHSARSLSGTDMTDAQGICYGPWRTQTDFLLWAYGPAMLCPGLT
eukprot:1673542-Rhodomonas_salina.2